MVECYIHGDGGRYYRGSGAIKRRRGLLLGGERGRIDILMYSFNSAQFGVKQIVGGRALLKWSQCAFFGVRSTKFGTNAALPQVFYRHDSP